MGHFWWGSIFLVNVPVVIFALIVGRLIVPNTKDPAAPKLDPVGASLSIVGLVALVYGIIEAPAKGWGSTEILAAFAIAAVVLTAFVVWELRSDHPMLNMGFFRNPRFTAASMSVALVFFALFGSLFFLTQYLQFVLGYTPLQAGLRVAPIAAVLIIAAPISGRLVSKVGTKVLVAGGMTLVAGGLFVLSTATISSGYGLVLTGLLVLGLGMGMAVAPATDSIMGSLPLGKAGVGSAMNDTTRQVGGALGVAILGSIMSSVYASSFLASAGGVPAKVAAEASSSLGVALQAGARIGGQGGEALVAAAKSAFVQGMDRGLLVGAAVALLGALVSLIWLPARARPVDAGESPPQAIDEGLTSPAEGEPAGAMKA